MQHRFVRQSPVHVWTTRRNTWTPPLGAETHSPPRVGTAPFYSWEAEPHTSHPTLCCKVNGKWSQKIILPENLMIVSVLHKICFSVMLWSLSLYLSSSLVCWCIQMRKTLILSLPFLLLLFMFPHIPDFLLSVLSSCVASLCIASKSNYPIYMQKRHIGCFCECVSQLLWETHSQRWRAEMVRVEEIDEWKESWTEGWAWWGVI